MKIAVLLSTYNGDRWLPQFLSSLRAQTRPIQLLWRDDGSQDGTVAVVREFHGLDLVELDHGEPGCNTGACASFAVIMEQALTTDSDLFLFADQDDVWAPTKVADMVEYFVSSEPHIPRLVHHDLRVVNTQRDVIAESLWRYMRLNPRQSSLAQFLTRNSVTGCAMAINRSLLEKVAPIGTGAIMHDWWIAAIASAVGSIDVLPSPLVDYRQHDDNTIGAKGFWAGLNPFTNWFEGWRRGNEEYRSLFYQARDLRPALIKAGVANDALVVLDTFLSLPNLPPLARMQAAHSLNLRDRGSLLWWVAMLRVATTEVQL